MNRSAFKIVIVLCSFLVGTVTYAMTLTSFFKNDVFLWHIDPKLPLADYKNIRLVSKECAQDMLTKLYQEYCQDKYVSMTSALLDCVHKSQYDEVKWFLLKKLDKNLYFTSGCLDHPCDIFVTPYMIAEHKNDKKMMALINECSVFSKKYVLHETVSQPVNINLCITACLGSIENFEQEYVKEYAIDQEKNVRNICPIIWAAMKNYDVNFIRNLLKHREYKLCMEQHGNALLAGIIFGILYEKYVLIGRPRTLFVDKVITNCILTRMHIDGVKKLIQSGCFKIDKHDTSCKGFCAMTVLDYFNCIKPNNQNFEEIKQLLSVKTMKEEHDDSLFL